MNTHKVCRIHHAAFAASAIASSASIHVFAHLAYLVIFEILLIVFNHSTAFTALYALPALLNAVIAPPHIVNADITISGTRFHIASGAYSNHSSKYFFTVLFTFQSSVSINIPIVKSWSIYSVDGAIHSEESH